MSKAKTTTIILIEDDPLVQIGLKQVVQTDPTLEIVGTERTAEAGLSTLRKYQPDILILDLGLPDESGINLIPKIQSDRHLNSTKIIVLTSQADTKPIHLALALGAKGYCLKGIEIEKLKTGIKLVANGDTYIQSQIAQLIAQSLVEQLDKQTENRTQHLPEQNLTPREYQVLQLLAQGMSNSEIANSLNFSTNTAKHYISQIASKLGAKNRTDLAVKSLRSGLVE